MNGEILDVMTDEEHEALWWRARCLHIEETGEEWVRYDEGGEA